MASHGIRGKVSDQVSKALAEASGSGWLGGGSLLPEAKVREAMEAEGVSCRQCLFTPLDFDELSRVVTLWTFLGQVMAGPGPGRSCRAAVARLLAWLAAQGPQGPQGPQGAQSASGEDLGESGDIDTGPYCKARERLPERLVSRLARQAGADLHARYPSGLLLASAVSSAERGARG
jgi:hypothetical protein